MCSYWLFKRKNNITRIEIIFPISWHSFIPPDHVFDHNEKDINQLEIRLRPEGNLEIFSLYSTVVKLWQNVTVYDWKTEISKTIEPTGSWPISSAPSKRIIINKVSSNVYVRAETA